MQICFMADAKRLNQFGHACCTFAAYHVDADSKVLQCLAHADPAITWLSN